MDTHNAFESRREAVLALEIYHLFLLAALSSANHFPPPSLSWRILTSHKLTLFPRVSSHHGSLTDSTTIPPSLLPPLRSTKTPYQFPGVCIVQHDPYLDPAVATQTPPAVDPLDGLPVHWLRPDRTVMAIEYQPIDIIIPANNVPVISDAQLSRIINTHKSMAKPKYETGKRFEDGSNPNRCNEALAGTGDMRLYGLIGKAVHRVEYEWEARGVTDRMTTYDQTIVRNRVADGTTGMRIATASGLTAQYRVRDPTTLTKPHEVSTLLEAHIEGVYRSFSPHQSHLADAQLDQWLGKPLRDLVLEALDLTAPPSHLVKRVIRLSGTPLKAEAVPYDEWKYRVRDADGAAKWMMERSAERGEKLFYEIQEMTTMGGKIWAVQTVIDTRGKREGVSGESVLMAVNESAWRTLRLLGIEAEWTAHQRTQNNANVTP